MKKALITGITGQDGSYLAELLLGKGYKVYGLVKNKRDAIDRENISHLKNDIAFIDGVLIDVENLNQVLKQYKPDEIYNLAAQSFVGKSWDNPSLVGQVNGLAVAAILEAIKSTNDSIRFYQASTSELYGYAQEVPQTENTPFYPRSPYAVAKLYGHWITKNFRESYGLYACSGILFNHESPRRGFEYVTRKITDAVAKIKYGLLETLYLGNLNAKKDWGYAGDYVRAMWLMLQQEKADDYVIASGESHTVREFVELAFKYADIDISWLGEGLNECAIDNKSQKVIVKVDPLFFRPVDTGYMLGNPEKARTQLGWQSNVHFPQLVEMMVNADLKRITNS